MISQIANIVSGFTLAIPVLKYMGAKDQFMKVGKPFQDHRSTIGAIELAIGVVALADRAIFHIGIPYLGSSYPQSIIAIIMGIILCANFFTQYKGLRRFIAHFEPYAEWIGLVGFFIGLFSLI